MTNQQHAPTMPKEIKQQLTEFIEKVKTYKEFIKVYQSQEERTDEAIKNQYTAHIELPTVRNRFTQLIHPYIYYTVSQSGPHLTTRTPVSQRYEVPDADAVLLEERMWDLLAEGVGL